MCSLVVAKGLNFAYVNFSVESKAKNGCSDDHVRHGVADD